MQNTLILNAGEYFASMQAIGCHASGGLFTFAKLFGNTACVISSKRRIIDESLKIRGSYEEKIFIFTFARAGLSAGAGRNFIWLVRITV